MNLWGKMSLTIVRCRRVVTGKSQGHFDCITVEYKKARTLSRLNYDTQAQRSR
jgi:hypothetical protein